MSNVILERTFDPPVTDERFAELSGRLGPCLERSNIQWIRSHRSLDRTRLLCLFEAPDADTVRDALRQRESSTRRSGPATSWSREPIATHQRGGEFRFLARISRLRDGVVLQETKLPRTRKHYSVTANPPWNRLHLNEVIFEGDVDDDIQVEILGEELDTLSPNDHLTPYRRTFEGPPASWVGVHKPGDEERESDPEWMDDWWVYLEIEKA